MKFRTTLMITGLLLTACSTTAPAQDKQLLEEGERAGEGPRQVALSPQASLSTIQVDPGLRVELVAAEPNVIDPVAIRFDEAGRLWVVEMSDYPLGGNNSITGRPSESRIRVLQDMDHDGFYESATTFADGLHFATGLLPWQQGVFVTMSGRVSYLEDRDGDGVADSEVIWYTGFAEENSQLRANDPRLALDGRIYVSNGLRGGKIVAADRPSEPLSISGRDFSFDPRSRAFGVETGGGQFGMSFDSVGHRFICSNREPVVHVVIPQRYADIVPTALPPSLKHLVARSGFESKLFPISRFWTTSNLHEGQFTAACSITIFLGNGLGDEYAGNAFTCDPTGNLVHREIVSDAGVTFDSSSPYDSREFLAASDSWFRPVNLEVGPDGALYVVDMHRAVIEHPQFVPEELKERPDQRWGDQQGRIYRITRTADRETRVSQWPTQEQLPSEVLLTWLFHPNGWQRSTAFRLLLNKSLTANEVAVLEAQVNSPENAIFAIQALAVLSTHDRLDLSLLESALNSPSPDVREFSLGLLSAWLDRKRPNGPLREGEMDTIRVCLERGIADAHPRVRFQSLLTLAMSSLSRDMRLSLLTQFPYEAELDSWQLHAILIAAHDLHLPLLERLLGQGATELAIERSHRTQVIRALAALLNRTDEAQLAVSVLLRAWSNEEPPLWTLPVLLAMHEADQQRFANALRMLLAQAPHARDRLVGELRRQAQDDSSTVERREAMLLLIDCDPNEIASLEKSFLSTTNLKLRTEVLSVLVTSHPSSKFWKSVTASFRTETPRNRQLILDGLLADNDRHAFLFRALKLGEIQVAEIDMAKRQSLLRRVDPTKRADFEALLAAAVDSDRAQVFERYVVSLNKQGDAEQGKDLFNKHCATCHRIGSLGTDVAPDISDSRTRSHQQLLADILQPNLAIDANYVAYVLETDEGKVFTGVIVEETSESIVLRMAEGKQTRFLRTELESILSTGKSLMPDGFEQDLSPAQMNDLISFIKNWRYQDNAVPQNSAKR